MTSVGWDITISEWTLILCVISTDSNLSFHSLVNDNVRNCHTLRRFRSSLFHSIFCSKNRITYLILSVMNRKTLQVKLHQIQTTAACIVCGLGPHQLRSRYLLQNLYLATLRHISLHQSQYFMPDILLTHNSSPHTNLCWSEHSSLTEFQSSAIKFQSSTVNGNRQTIAPARKIRKEMSNTSCMVLHI